MPALDLSLGLPVIGCPADVLHTLVFEPVGEIACNIRGANVAQKPRPVRNVDVIKS